jgi:hypothetical protein
VPRDNAIAYNGDIYPRSCHAGSDSASQLLMSNSRQLVELLLEHQAHTVHVSGDTIVVDPKTANGFVVSLIERGDKWVVHFDGWHQHFASEDDAVRCVVFGLSRDCRLKVEYRGSVARRWTVEARTDHGWREDSTVGLLWFPFWRRARIEYRQNDLNLG